MEVKCYLKLKKLIKNTWPSISKAFSFVRENNIHLNEEEDPVRIRAEQSVS